MNTIEAAWERIEAWYAANTPEDTLMLAPGATEEEIVHLEDALGFRLPDDLRASFALHNGALAQKSLEHAYMLDFGEFLSLKSVLYWHKELLRWQDEDDWGRGPDYEAKDIKGPIKPIWWNPLRLRLMENNGRLRPGTWRNVGANHRLRPRSGANASAGREFWRVVERLSARFGRWQVHL